MGEVTLKHRAEGAGTHEAPNAGLGHTSLNPNPHGGDIEAMLVQSRSLAALVQSLPPHDST